MHSGQRKGYYGRHLSRGSANDQPVRAPSPASSTSSISNPALLAVERPHSPTRGGCRSSVLRVAVCGLAWASGVTLFGSVGHSIGWVVLRPVSVDAAVGFGCVVGAGVAGAAVLSVPSLVLGVAAVSVLRTRPPAFSLRTLLLCSKAIIQHPNEHDIYPSRFSGYSQNFLGAPVPSVRFPEHTNSSGLPSQRD